MTPIFLPNLRELENLVWVPANALVFCPIPKVACSNWKSTLQRASDADDVPAELLHDRQRNGLTYVSELPFYKRLALLKGRSVTRAVFVRNPWTRLLSAYRDKIERTLARGPREGQWNEHITETMAALTELAGAREAIRFPHFVQLLEDTPAETWNEHWMPQWMIARFDRIRYDFIGRLENLAHDARRLVDRVGLESFERGKSSFVAPTGSDGADVLERYYTPELVARVGRLFQRDVEMLGYAFPSGGGGSSRG